MKVRRATPLDGRRDNVSAPKGLAKKVGCHCAEPVATASSLTLSSLPSACLLSLPCRSVACDRAVRRLTLRSAERSQVCARDSAAQPGDRPSSHASRNTGHRLGRLLSRSLFSLRLYHRHQILSCDYKTNALSVFLNNQQSSSAHSHGTRTTNDHDPGQRAEEGRSIKEG